MAVDVKICGIKTPETMAAALDAGTNFVGLVFFPASPRNVTIGEAAVLAAQARGHARIVALVVDADDAMLDLIMEKVSPDLLQLHGTESPERVAAVRARYGRAVLKAIKVANPTDAELALHYVDAADVILFDARPPGGADRPGGHGAVFDWHALDGVKSKVSFMLSGGLTPANVAAAILATGAASVDVSSGVETAPGVKDPALIRAFIAAARSVPPTGN